VRTAEGGINALVNRCAHKGSMIYYRPSGHMSELTCPYHNWVYDFASNLKKRSVVLDSSPIDTLLVFERAAVIEFMMIPGAAPSSGASVRTKLLPAPAGDMMI
jgi:hypothetical protein